MILKNIFWKRYLNGKWIFDVILFLAKCRGFSDLVENLKRIIARAATLLTKYIIFFSLRVIRFLQIMFPTYSYTY